MNQELSPEHKPVSTSGGVGRFLTGLLLVAAGYLGVTHDQANAPKVSYAESQNEIDYLQTVFAEYRQYAREKGEFEKNGVYFGYEGKYFYIQYAVQNAGGYGRTRISFDANGKPAYFTYDGATESELHINEVNDSDHYTRSTRAIRYNFQTGQFHADSALPRPDNTVTEHAIMQQELNRMLRDFVSRVKGLLQTV